MSSSFALDQHLPGCSPLNPCKHCKLVAMLRTKLGPTDFDEVVQLFNEPATPSQPAMPPETPVSELGLSTRVLKTLKNDNLHTIGEALARIREHGGIYRYRAPNFGRISRNELAEALSRAGHAVR